MKRILSRAYRILPVLLAGWLALPATAEVLRLEAVGAVPLREGSSSQKAPRDAAIQAALRESVGRVARQLLAESHGGSDSVGADQPISSVLGRNMVQYMTRFRIVEDRGEQGAIFSDDPEVTTEYVVIVESMVDVDRVRARLMSEGLLVDSSSSSASVRVRVEVEGLDYYPAYEALRDLLRSEAGAHSVLPAGFERGRALLLVEADRGPAVLLNRLVAASNAELDIRALRGSRESASRDSAVPTIRVAVRWTPPPPDEGEPRSGPVPARP